jgi:hypothetical protein
MTDLQKLVEQWAKEAAADGAQFHCDRRWLEGVCRLAMQYAAEEAAKTLMEMHAGAKGQHNYYHFAANKIRERFKAL